MPLSVPQIDDRNYEQILAEALARIPVHNPEWTNFNDSDPGITLIQLFAFMTENLLYRSNLIPKRNRKKFLKLLGVPLQPAASAEGFVTFSNLRGTLKTITLESSLEVLAGSIPFRTKDGLDVLPVETLVCYKSPLPKERRVEAENLSRQLYPDLEAAGAPFNFYETRRWEQPVSGAPIPALDLSKQLAPMADLPTGGDLLTVDGSIWLALLARPQDRVDDARQAIAHRVLTLGLMPAVMGAAKILRPGGAASVVGQPDLVFEIPVGGLLPSDPVARKIATYRKLEILGSQPGADLLSVPGVVQLSLPDASALRIWEGFEPLEQGVGDFPPYLDDPAIENRVITWVRIRLRERQSGTVMQSKARLSWVDINAARVSQCTQVFGESLGEGTGNPDQVVRLANASIIPGSVKLMVQGEEWHEIDDLLAADAEVPLRNLRLGPGAPLPAAQPQKAAVFTVDRESGEIRFGDGLHGARPPRNASILANYSYGGGAKGNLGVGAINKSPNLPAGLKVTNPLPTWGGDEAESVEQAERLIPAYLRHQDRLVSVADFDEITWRTPGVDLGRVTVIPLMHPEQGEGDAAGVVTVMVIPSSDPLYPDAPIPDQFFLDRVCNHLDPRRLITTEIHVQGPKYVSILVSVGIEVIPGKDVAPVHEAVKNELRHFFSPLTGGYDGTGWPLKKAVDSLELSAKVSKVDGVAKVKGVLLAIRPDSPVSQICPVDQVPMQGLELPRIAGLAVQQGDPPTLAEVLGGAAPAPEMPATAVPVPMISPECF